MGRTELLLKPKEEINSALSNDIMIIVEIFVLTESSPVLVQAFSLFQFQRGGGEVSVSVTPVFHNIHVSL